MLHVFLKEEEEEKLHNFDGERKNWNEISFVAVSCAKQKERCAHSHAHINMWKIRNKVMRIFVSTTTVEADDIWNFVEFIFSVFILKLHLMLKQVN